MTPLDTHSPTRSTTLVDCSGKVRSVLSLDPSLSTCWVVQLALHTQISNLHGSTAVYSLSGCDLSGWHNTDQYSPWIHRCVHVEWLCPWLMALHTQVSTLHGSSTVYMLSGCNLGEFFVHTDQYSPWIHRSVNVEWCNLGGFFVQTWRTEWFVVIKAERSACVDQSERFCVR